MYRYVDGEWRRARVFSKCGHEGCTNQVMVRGWCLEHHPVCSEPGCTRLAYARGQCSPHYQRWYCSGDRKHPPKRGYRRQQQTQCGVAGCPNNTVARGVCMKHYKQWQRAGKYGIDD